MKVARSVAEVLAEHTTLTLGCVDRMFCSYELTAGKVDALLRKWLARLPHPFTAPDRQQGIRYEHGAPAVVELAGSTFTSRTACRCSSSGCAASSPSLR